MPPPPAEGFASRIFLGPALRAQPDRRLVSLVRQGYEAAFEEIVRRYNQALGRYAGAIVPRHRAEDVTQDAFSKALLALRDTDAEIELRPWLYRIVRNTALNDLRDQPLSEELDEALPGPRSAHEEAVRREELRELMTRLRALPEPQRAAIVMRELEGLSHEEIAASLGLSGGGARQTIYRARRALRDGAGMLVPMPLLKALLTGGAIADAGATGVGAAGASATLAGAGSGGAAIGLKAAAATVLVAGTVGTGIAVEQHSGPQTQRADAATIARPDRSPGGGSGSGSGTSTEARGSGPADTSGSGPGPGRENHDSGSGARSGSGSGGEGGSSSSGPRGGENLGSSGHEGPGPSSGGGGGGGGGEGHIEHSGSGHSGSGGPEPGEGGSGSSGPGGGGGGSEEPSHSGSSGPGPSGSTLPPPPTELPEIETSGSGSSNSGPGSGSSGSSGSGSSGPDAPEPPDN